jgi:NAD(P)-dependent dehydrogenase (short-subunit alcohol dehydrogenase family)
VYEGVDVQNTAAVDAFAKKLAAEQGTIDVLINNAGYFYGPEETVLGSSLNFDEELKQIDVCALGPLRVSAALVQSGAMTAGSVVTIITSQAGSVEWRFTQNPEGGDYGTCLVDQQGGNLASIFLANVAH